MKFPSFRALPLAALPIAFAACGDPAGLRAFEPTAFEQLSVYAISGTSTALPTALNTPEQVAVRADGLFNYDVVFDIDAQGRVVLYPMELVTTPEVGTHRVGLLRSTDSFDNTTRAPGTGYSYDQPLVVEVGAVVVIEANVPRYCGFPFPERMYSKIGIDSIDLAQRSIRLRMVLNPNCGFRSFLSGIPVD